MAESRSALSGVLLLDKPAGMSSQGAVSRVRRLLGAAKAGHTGTLDPLATGLLPVCVGEATKFSHVLLEADKTYEASVRLGVTTATGDREGTVMAISPVTVQRGEIERALARFVGEIEQIPPMFSALKHEGRPLYKLARAGITVPRQARRVRIQSLELAEMREDVLKIRVVCGKGTYIRVLAEDIGRALGCGAHLDALRRTAVGVLTERDATRIEVLEAESREERTQRLLSVDTPVQGLPRVELAPNQSRHLLQGRTICQEVHEDVGLVRLYERFTGRFLGVGMLGAGGTITARRLMASGTDIA